MYTLVSTMAQRKNQSPHSSTNWGRSLSTRTLGGGGAPNSQRGRERGRERERVLFQAEMELKSGEYSQVATDEKAPPAKVETERGWDWKGEILPKKSL